MATGIYRLPAALVPARLQQILLARCTHMSDDKIMNETLRGEFDLPFLIPHTAQAAQEINWRLFQFARGQAQTVTGLLPPYCVRWRYYTSITVPAALLLIA